MIEDIQFDDTAESFDISFEENEELIAATLVDNAESIDVSFVDNTEDMDVQLAESDEQIEAAFDEVVVVETGTGNGDMKKIVYDKNGNGVVDDSEKLGGQLPEYYAKVEDLFSGSYNDLSDQPDIPTSLSELSDDAENRTVSDEEKAIWNAKANSVAVAEGILAATQEAMEYTDTKCAEQEDAINKALSEKADHETVAAALDEAKEYSDTKVSEHNDAVNQELAKKANADAVSADIEAALAEAKSYTDQELADQGAVDLDDYVQKEDGKGLSTNDLTDALKTNYDAAYTHSQSTHVSSTGSYSSMKVGGLTSTLGVSTGGTGKTTHTSNAVLTGNGASAVKNVATKSGAFYATAANGAAQFGTLPVDQGGTGATTIWQTVGNLREALIDCIYPVGSIYLSMTSTDPNTLFGYGTWERISQGRYLVGVGGNAKNTTDKWGSTSASTVTFNGAGEMGGEAKHQLTVNEMPSHDHRMMGGWGEGTMGDGYFRVDQNSPSVHWNNTYKSGGDVAHNNMPPYFSVYMWKRTA